MPTVAPIAITELPEDTLFRHTKRPDWGLALSVERTDSAWRMQFEDGKLRKLGATFLHLCAPVALPLDERDAMVERLSAAAGVQVARQDAAASGRPLITLGQQVTMFRLLYPEGFAGASWLKKNRGVGRRIKRHRDPAILEAQEQLSEQTLNSLIGDGYYAEVIAHMRTVLANTTLVAANQLQPLAALEAQDQATVAKALQSLLYGSGRFDAHMHEFLKAFKPVGGASWPLATSLPALVHPDRHVPVALSTMRTQARWLMPDLSIPNQPAAAYYLRLLSMVKGLAATLTEEGLPPRDLLDVTDFMRETLRPSTHERLASMPPPALDRATAEPATTPDDSAEAAPASGTRETDADDQAA